MGNPKDLTARFGSYLSFSITTPVHQESAALAVVRSMAPGARLMYALGGTQVRHGGGVWAGGVEGGECGG